MNATLSNLGTNPQHHPEGAPLPLLSVIIVSFNTRELTLGCLRHLFPELEHLRSRIRSEVWVVDNASADGSAAAIRSEFPEVHLLQNTRNLGFGAANNLALRQAAGQFFLLLNSDAFLRPGAVRALLDYLRRTPRAGAVGPRLANPDGSLQVSCFRFPSPLRAWLENLGLARLLSWHPRIADYHAWAHNSNRIVDFVSGACMLIRREAWQSTGDFDERFFLYSEEADWQRRMHDAGWLIGFTPAAQAVHFGGASGHANPQFINEHFFQSLDRYQHKHHGHNGFFSLRCAMSVGSLARLFFWTARLLLPLLASDQRQIARRRLRMHGWLLLRQSGLRHLLPAPSRGTTLPGPPSLPLASPSETTASLAPKA
ncbi:MAG: hypothetical protein RLZZ244_1611 [Verrucomicrobiota bacterium]|jgi:GT2 family glycosyltransferase